MMRPRKNLSALFILRSTYAYGRSALSEDDLTNRTGSGHLEKTPSIAATIRITTISQKIADINTAMARNAAEFILGRCIYDPRIEEQAIVVSKLSADPIIARLARSLWSGDGRLTGCRLSGGPWQPKGAQKQKLATYEPYDLLTCGEWD
jgi:hypothetical protein